MKLFRNSSSLQTHGNKLYYYQIDCLWLQPTVFIIYGTLCRTHTHTRRQCWEIYFQPLLSLELHSFTLNKNFKVVVTIKEDSTTSTAATTCVFALKCLNSKMISAAETEVNVLSIWDEEKVNTFRSITLSLGLEENVLNLCSSLFYRTGLSFSN